VNRFIAHVFSVLGHPLLISTYLLLLLLATNPYAFGVSSLGDPKAERLFLSVFSTSVLLPGVGIGLMRPLGLVRTLELSDKLERTGPYIITGVFYGWLFMTLNGVGAVPNLYAVVLLGATIGLFLNFFFNIFFKISAHAAGMGGLLASLLLTTREWSGAMLGIGAFGGTVYISLIWVLAAAILLAGLVGTARLALGAHTPYELWRGYLSGAAAVFLAAMVL
jgi:hypothetical protein